MELELIENKGTVFIGDKLVVKTKLKFEEDTSILWSGVSLITKPPCQSKELQISKAEIFSMGFYEAGGYIRERSISIKNSVVPTIKKRNLEYFLRLVLRQENPIDPNSDLVVKKTQNIEIKVKESKLRQIKPNPISFSISGLNIQLSKDVFKPGETIKINYTSSNLREFEVKLLQKADLVCYCETYGKSCISVEELPPAIAGDVKTSNTDKGYLLLKIPDIAEPSHNYLWEPSDKEYWGMKYGDYTEWSLQIFGRKKPEFGRDLIQFKLPITIVSQPIFIEEEKSGMDLFTKGVTGGMNIFEEVSSKSKFQKRFQLLSIDLKSEEDSELKEYRIKIKNISNEDLEGVTVRLFGLQEGLFETRYQTRGFNSWLKGEEKELTYSLKQDISAIVSNIEDNSQESVRIQTPI